MANTAFDHASALTLPGSTTNNGLVRWGDTSGTSFGNITGITSDGSNITLLTRGEIRFSDADSSHFIAFESPATVSTSYTMALPAAVPSANDYLKVTSYSGGAGVLEWASVSADTNTTYSTSWVDSSNDAILRLTPSTGSADDLTLVAGTNITLTPSGDNLTITSTAGGATINNATANEIVTVASTTTQLDAESELTYDGTDFKLMKGGASATGASLAIETYNDGGNPARLRLRTSRSDTQGTQAIMTSGFPLGYIQFEGSDGSAFRRTAVISAWPTENWSGSSWGTRLEFHTTDEGSTSHASRMLIDHDGAVSVYEGGDAVSVQGGLAKAFVRFNNTTMESKWNVSSITDHGTGSWTVNMTNGMGTADDHMIVCVPKSGDATTNAIVVRPNNDAFTATICRLTGLNRDGAARDPSGGSSIGVCCVIYGVF